jgi:hypothetical protein
MMSPTLLASVPYRNRTAFADAVSILANYHTVLADTIGRQTGRAVVLYPLGDGRGEREWLQALEQQHAAEARALGIAPPPSLSDFNLGDPTEWASFWWIMSEDLERLRLASGIV